MLTEFTLYAKQDVHYRDVIIISKYAVYLNFLIE